ncbi:alpha/beta hydrolase [Halocynthiibacter styelae]|uniref:Alpha/beta hydrolase n=1 Tax=Halocynthiibacter styelae TaxID=2761955 RepID=A0A8J7LWK8_9RHOB|nr:alpha/beta hydrolase [Paenihalocynthiibacter styelae]MBI1494512.1 alpha/beta hydrolase [Paenihalocynthiibacter styelae]
MMIKPHHIPVDATQLQAGKNRVHFMSEGSKIAGDLYLPEGFVSSGSYPTIVYTRPGSQVKEQTGAVYGAKLAAKGYIFLVFDPKNFGDSEGHVRNYESIHNAAPNTTDAISFLRTMPFVDRDRFFGLGLCAGAPYICNVAIGDARVKAVATVVGNFDAAALLFGGYPKETIDQLMAAAAEGKQRYYEAGEYATADIFGGLPRPAPEQAPAAMREAIDYYFFRVGADTCPNYSNEFPLIGMPLDPARTFVGQAKYFQQPLMVIAGSEAATRDMDKNVFEIAAEPKEYLEIEGASHMDLYDQDQFVDQAVDAVDSFYKKSV